MFYKPDLKDARIEWISKDKKIRPLPTPPWDETAIKSDDNATVDPTPADQKDD